MTMTTSYTISTTSTTTYLGHWPLISCGFHQIPLPGPRYSLEMDGFAGRPYGIYATDDLCCKKVSLWFACLHFIAKPVLTTNMQPVHLCLDLTI